MREANVPHVTVAVIQQACRPDSVEDVQSAIKQVKTLQDYVTNLHPRNDFDEHQLAIVEEKLDEVLTKAELCLAKVRAGSYDGNALVREILDAIKHIHDLIPKECSYGVPV